LKNVHVVIFVTSYACLPAVCRHPSTQFNIQHKLLNVSYLSRRELKNFEDIHIHALEVPQIVAQEINLKDG